MSFGKTGYRDGGNRGGHDRFKWDQVKEDKYRENYLGHSLKAPVGRWQKGKDLQWYTKAGKRPTAEEAAELRKQELEEIRRRDEELINEKLGLAPKRHAVVETQLEAAEIKALLARGASERDRLDVERVEGLGAAPAPRHEHLPKGKTLVERELERMKKAQEEGRAFEYEDGAVQDVASGDEGQGSSDGGDGGAPGGDDKKRAKKEKKRLKKEKKRMKKETKKERKRGERGEREGKGAGAEEAGGSKRGRSRSRSRSRSRGRGRSRSRDGERRRGRVGSESPSRSRGRDAKRRRSRSYSR